MPKAILRGRTRWPPAAIAVAPRRKGSRGHVLNPHCMPRAKPGPTCAPTPATSLTRGGFSCPLPMVGFNPDLAPQPLRSSLPSQAQPSLPSPNLLG